MGVGVRCWIFSAMLVVCGGSARGLDPHRSVNQYGRQVWQTDNGLPQNTVRAIAQTPDGYLWVGTDEGLVRFDGNEFKVFAGEGAPTGAVTGLTVDRHDRLWVVTAGGLAVYAQGRFKAVGLAEGLPDAAVWFVHEDGRGHIWVATASGLCVLTANNRCEPMESARGLSVTEENRLAEGRGEEGKAGSIWLASGAETVELDAGSRTLRRRLKTAGGTEILTQRVGSDGHLLVGTREGLQVEQGGVLVPVRVKTLQRRVAVNAMVTTREGDLWLGTSAGLMQAAGGDVSQVKSVTQEAVQTVFADREGAVWAGTSGGVVRVAEGRVEGFRAGDALAGSGLLALLEDREGNVWLGTESDGLTVLHEQKFTTYTTMDGLSGNVVRAVYQDAAGTIWVGTDGGGLSRRTGSGFQKITTKEGLSSDVVLALAGGRDGNLWVGTPTGLNLVRGGSVKVLTTADGLPDDYIRSLLVDRKGNVWVGTRHGLTRIAGAVMTTLTALDGLGSDFIGAMIEDRKGDLWIGTSGGLTRLHEGKFTNFKVKDALAKNVVTAMLEDSAGTLWLGTSGGGLSRLRDGVIVPVPATNLPQAISGVLEDGEKRLWISSRNGIFRVEEPALNRAIKLGSKTVEVAAYDTSDGMRIREASSGGHPASVRLRDGTMWFATLRGVSVVDPEHLDENRIPPLVALETVLVNDVPQELPGGELVLAPGNQRVEFQYAGLSFVAPQKVEYRYWLEGFDKYWVEAGAHRAAFYTNLRPGQYVFHVAAANNDGVWSNTDAAIRLRVRPFFWQTWWFYVLLLAAAAGFAYLIYARRVRRVQAMYKGVMEERGRIAREIHDTLAQGIVSISLQLEVVKVLMGSSMEAAKAQLDETRLLVRQSLADARSSIWDLRSEEAEELPVRLGRSLKLLTATGGAMGRLTVTGSYRAIARGVEDELLRIGQEAVTNAVRHADCSHIDVTLAYDMKAVRLMVRDDGRGFDAQAAGPGGHFGLQGMRERAAKIQGRLQVESVPGEGSTVSVEVALS